MCHRVECEHASAALLEFIEHTEQLLDNRPDPKAPLERRDAMELRRLFSEANHAALYGWYSCGDGGCRWLDEHLAPLTEDMGGPIRELHQRAAAAKPVAATAAKMRRVLDVWRATRL